MGRVPELSRCPFCGALGVKLFEPLTMDGHQADVPYCGKCGKNYPADHRRDRPRDNVAPFGDPKKERR